MADKLRGKAITGNVEPEPTRFSGVGIPGSRLPSKKEAVLAVFKKESKRSVALMHEWRRDNKKDIAFDKKMQAHDLLKGLPIKIQGSRNLQDVVGPDVDLFASQLEWQASGRRPVAMDL